MARFWIGSLTVALAALAAGCGEEAPPKANQPPVAANPKTSARPAPAAPAKTNKIDALEQLPADSAFVLVIPDPLPHVKQVLTHPALRRLLTEGSLAEFFAQSAGGGLDPTDIWRTINDNRNWVPDEIAIGISDGSMEGIDHSVRGFVLSLLYISSNALGNEVAEADQEKIHKQLLEEFGEIELPRVTIWCEFRSQSVADLAWQTSAQVSQQLSTLGLPVTQTTDGIRVTGILSDVMPPATIAAMLSEYGFGEYGDASLDELAATLGKFAFDASLEQSGMGLRLSIGPAPANGSMLSAEQLGPLFQTIEQDVMYARWDARGFKEATAGWNALWKEWEDTEIGQFWQSLDAEDFVGDLATMELQSQAMADQGAMRLWTEASTLRATIVDEGAPAGMELRGSRLIGLIPNEVDAYFITGLATVREQFAGFVSRFEERLATKSLQSDLTGDIAQSSIYNAISSNYYTEFADFRDLVLQDSDTFQSQAAMIISTKGRAASLTFPAIDADFRDLPMIEFAVIGVVNDAGAAQAYVEDVYREFVAGAYGALGNEFPADFESVREEDLGLGVPTYVFNGTWLRDGDQDYLQLQGDFQPHMFFREELLVVSTSARLSKLMLNTDEAVLLPTVTGEGKLTACSSLPGRTIGESYDLLAQWLEAFAKVGGARSQLPTSQKLILQGLGEAADLIQEISWETIESDSKTHTDARVVFRGQ